uniref:Ig-like domain-containing protein n=1 Tax=Astyanax mexicanus TaxID=7994 RepID=A0A3B1J8Y6_ASTMX
MLNLSIFIIGICIFFVLAPLDVHVFAKPSVSDSSKLTLTCLATGFYPKDATVIWRRSSSPLSEDLITSSAVRPNDDGTYQLRKTEKDQYECYVTHRTLKEPVIKKLGKYIRFFKHLSFSVKNVHFLSTIFALLCDSKSHLCFKNIFFIINS